MSKPLRELADVYYGKSPNEVVSDEAVIPIIGTGGVYGRATRAMYQGPAVIVPRKGSLGNPQFIGEPFWPADTTYAVLPKSKVDAKWLYYSLAAFDLTKLNEATGVPSINRDWLYRIKLGSDEFNEQRRIAEILSTVDAAIEQMEGLIAKYQQIKAGLMHDLFTRGITPDGHLRPAIEGQRTKFGWIPKGWKIGSLLDVADQLRQPILTGPFGADMGSDDFVSEGVPVLRIGNVQQGRLDLSDLLYVSEDKARQLQRYKVNEGDLLFARQGATTGRNALASGDVQGYLINYHIIRVALDHSLCAPLFIEAVFAGEIVKRQVERDKGRGTREGINTAQLKALELPLASVDEQRSIARVLMTHTALCAVIQRQLVNLRQQKQGLMQDLLTGRVRVKVAEPVGGTV